ncbi:MAG: hypothetical protein WBC44_07010 [Planctomycetaceae bacterium]
MTIKADLCRILFAKRAEVAALVKAGDAGKLAGRHLSKAEADVIHGALIMVGLMNEHAEATLPKGLK